MDNGQLIMDNAKSDERFSDWRTVRLADVIDIIGGGTPKTSIPEYWNGCIPWLSVVDFNSDNRYVGITEKTITEAGLKNSSAKLLNPGDLIISARGTVGAIAQVTKPMAFNQSCYGIRAKHNAINDFIYYSMKNIVLEIKKNTHGSVFATITKDTFDILKIDLPSLAEQRGIAGVLSSLDDKIEINNRLNKKLEETAQAIFKAWFVDGAGDDWEEKTITELFEIRDGTHDSPKQKICGKPLLTSKHILTNKLDIDNAYLISEEDFESIKKRSEVATNDILFSMIGTIGLIYLEQSESIEYAIKNIGLFKTSQNKKWRYYTFLWLKSALGEKFIREHRKGSTQEYISLGSLRSIIFNIPPDKLFEKFNSLIEPIFEKIKINSKEIKVLEKMRDSLLPKLMSGEIRVKKEEKEE